MQDVSAFGFTARVRTSITFPAGFDLTAFADDSDPFDLPSLQIADAAMGVNGDLVVWSKATPISVTIGMIEGSDDEQNLALLAELNRVGRGKVAVNDTVTITVVYPDGRTFSLLNGKLTNAMPGPSVASSGRLKSKVYMFKFENRIGSAG